MLALYLIGSAAAGVFGFALAELRHAFRRRRAPSRAATPTFHRPLHLVPPLPPAPIPPPPDNSPSSEYWVARLEEAMLGKGDRP